jgi:signal recognition particle subunit SRP19
MQKKNKIILWPAYFDSTKTRLQGRRIPKATATPSPRLDELQRAAQKCGLQVEVSPDFKHPHTPWQKTGLILVTKNVNKTNIIRRVAKELSSMRAQNRF